MLVVMIFILDKQKNTGKKILNFNEFNVFDIIYNIFKKHIRLLKFCNAY